MTGEEGGLRVRLPGDVDQPDRIVFGLTARQLGLLTPPAAAALALLAAGWGHLPAALLVALAAPLALAALVVAVAAPGGRPVEELAVAALRHLTTPAVTVPAGDRRLPRRLAPLRLPTGDGLAVAEVAPVALALAAPDEQAGALAAFGQALNSLAAPVQLLVRTEALDVAALSARLQQAAGALAHPNLEVAARAHAAHLLALAGTRPYRRRVYLISRGAPLDPAVWTGAGLRLRVLSAPEVTALLADAYGSPPPAAGARAANADATVTARTSFEQTAGQGR